jgi:DNA-binding response OmpR family regulator
MAATLLIIEDEANIRTFITVNLRARGFDVIEASSAEEGLQLLQNRSPTAIILDILLPGMSGWDMLHIMSQDADLKGVPVILMTASASNVRIADIDYSNVVHSLPKPVSAGELVNVIHKALA